MKLTKQDAVELFGGKAKDLAAGLGLTPSAISQWPEELRQDQADRIMGAALRLGLLRAWRVRPGYQVPQNHEEAA